MFCAIDCDAMAPRPLPPTKSQLTAVQLEDKTQHIAHAPAIRGPTAFVFAKTFVVCVLLAVVGVAPLIALLVEKGCTFCCFLSCWGERSYEATVERITNTNSTKMR